MVPPEKRAECPNHSGDVKKINTFVHLVPFTIAPQKLG
jgi:hypothetical protein